MDISYFMDECTYWELNDVIDNLPYLDRNLWETSRLNAYVVAQGNCRKKLQMQDICKFKWEEETEKQNQDISNKDIERLKAKAKKYEHN